MHSASLLSTQLFVICLLWLSLCAYVMRDENELYLLRRRIRPTQTTMVPSNIMRVINAPSPSGASGGVIVLNYPRQPLRTSGPPSPKYFMRLGPHTLKEQRASTSEEYCSYLANLTGRALEEELLTLAYYTWHTFVALSIGRVNRCYVFLSCQQHKQKQQLKERFAASHSKGIHTCKKCINHLLFLSGR